MLELLENVVTNLRIIILFKYAFIQVNLNIVEVVGVEVLTLHQVPLRLTRQLPEITIICPLISRRLLFSVMIPVRTLTKQAIIPLIFLQGFLLGNHA